jgi:uncharacterized protein
MPKTTFLTANWLNLIMLNYEVDPAVLKPYIPAGTELDLWEGKALVSVVGFLFHDTRVLGVRWPFHVNFEEVNLRFYVRYFDGEVWKRGAVFISELVPKRPIALIANKLYREHYRTLPMRHAIRRLGEDETQYLYEWKLNHRWNKLGAVVSDEPTHIAPGSAEEFIFEHYWGYNIWDAVTTMQYEVAHISWLTRRVTDYVFDADVAALYGDAFVPYLQGKPYSAFFANGSAIRVRKGKKIKVGTN